ncbi:MAG: hypothetical protein WA705_25620 [Candidatus Ozemobacteraceae bacterium]
MIKKRKGLSSKGMALIIVLAISAALLVMGLSYIQTFSQSRPVNPKVLEKLQADFLAGGLQRIALLKFKRFPEDFYHAYFYQVAWDNPAKRPSLTAYTPLPLQEFKDDPVLQFGISTFASPLVIASYSTNYSLLSHKNYASDSLDITVTVRLAERPPDKTATHTYSLKIDASRVRVP